MDSVLACDLVCLDCDGTILVPIQAKQQLHRLNMKLSMLLDIVLLYNYSKFHLLGILMVFAWPVLAWLGIGMARHMKPALPNGGWFLLHRFLVISSLVVTCISFALIFIAFRNTEVRGLITLGDMVSCVLSHDLSSCLLIFVQNEVGTAHFAIGIAVVILQLSNVSIIVIFKHVCIHLVCFVSSQLLLFSDVIQEQTSKLCTMKRTC